MSKIFLISFVSPDLHSPAQRFVKQARSTGWFDDIFIYGYDKRLSNYTPVCIENNLHLSFPRGYGLWAWKSDILKHFTRNHSDIGDSILYLDIGFEFNPGGAELFDFLHKQVMSDYFIVSRTRKAECFYNNRYTVNSINRSLRALLTPQYQAGFMFFKNTENSRLFLLYWDSQVRSNDYLSLTSKGLFEPIFGENRHDQSVFSLLAKRDLKLSSINNPLSFSTKLIEKSRYVQGFPFYSMRNMKKTPLVSHENFNAKQGLVQFLEYYLLRFYLKFKSNSDN